MQKRFDVELSECTSINNQWRHYKGGGEGADRPGWHPPGGDTRMKKICGQIYKE